MKTGLATKTLIMLVTVALVLIAYIILKVHPITIHPRQNPTTSTSAQNLYPKLTASTTTLKLGDHITVGTTLLTPTEVIQDSRCGTGLQCFQAGTVILAINVSADDGASVLNLSIGTPVISEGLTITLTTVTPYPQAQEKINPADYRFTLNVQRNLQ